ncbi:MAG: DUF1178 family protein [Hydrogenophaga sp.]
MKVLNLQCELEHAFEGWFASEDDFSRQLSSGLLSCPVCGASSVHKLPSAPRLNLGHARAPEADRVPGGDLPASAAATDLPAAQGLMLRALRQIVNTSEDVGERFAEEARAMHQGKIESRAIRGRTSPGVALELIEEGIDVLPLPDLPALKETLQ